MEIRYRIIEKNEALHSITVRFTTSTLDDEVFDMNVQEEYFEMENGKEVRKFRKHLREDGSTWACKTDRHIELPYPAPEGEELHLFILQFAPVYQLEREEKLWPIPYETNTLDSISIGDSHTRDVEDMMVALKVQRLLSSKEVNSIDKILDDLINGEATSNNSSTSV